MKRTHIVMDHTGDTRTTFDSVEEARVHFDELLRTHVAAKKLRPGEFAKVREFDPVDTEVVFFRHLVGG